MSAAIHSAAHLPMTDEQSRVRTGSINEVYQRIRTARFAAHDEGDRLLREFFADLEKRAEWLLKDHGDDLCGDSPAARRFLQEVWKR
jgi:hypothetical protein